MIVDSHVHVVDESRVAFDPQPFGSDWYRTHAVSMEGFEAELDAAGVAHAILVQAVGAYGHDCRYLAEAVTRGSDRYRWVCSVDPRRPDAIEALRGWVELGATGVRLFAIGPYGDDWLDSPTTFNLWRLASERGLVVVATVLPGAIGRLAAPLERFAEVSVALDHCGFAEPDRDGWADLQRLSGFANLHLKLSSIALGLDRDVDAAVRVARFASLVGTQRLLWGSDYPQTHGRSYPEIVGFARSATASLGIGPQAEILGGNAARLWGW